MEAFLQEHQDHSNYISVTVISSAVGMSEQDLLDAAFRSRTIKRGMANRMMGEPQQVGLRYGESAPPRA